MYTLSRICLSPAATFSLLRRVSSYGLLALLSFAALPAVAQKASVRNDTVFRDGAAYARVHTSGTDSHPNYSFRTLGGDEFMMMTFDDAADDYRVIFFPGEEQTRLPGRYGSLGVMAQEVVDNRLVESGAFNPAGLKRFMLAHPATASPGAGRAKTTAPKTTAPRTSGNSTSESIRKIDNEVEATVGGISEAISNIGAAVERAFDKDSARRAERGVQKPTGARVNGGLPLTATAKEIRKNGVVIATYDVRNGGTVEKGGKIFTIRAPGGALIAKATVPHHAPPKAARILTTIDDRTTALPLDGRTQEEDAADIGTWLLAKGYLK